MPNNEYVQEIMKVKGFQVAPAELEGCLLDHAAVSDACVVGVPDDYSARLLASTHAPTHTHPRIYRRPQAARSPSHSSSSPPPRARA